MGIRDFMGKKRLQGPIRIEAKSVQRIEIGGIGVDVVGSMAELKQRGFALTLEKCE